MARPRDALFPRPRPAVSVTVLLNVFSEIASTNVKMALAWSTVFAFATSDPTGCVSANDSWSPRSFVASAACDASFSSCVTGLMLIVCRAQGKTSNVCGCDVWLRCGWLRCVSRWSEGAMGYLVTRNPKRAQASYTKSPDESPFMNMYIYCVYIYV